MGSTLMNMAGWTWCSVYRLSEERGGGGYQVRFRCLQLCSSTIRAEGAPEGEERGWLIGPDVMMFKMRRMGGTGGHLHILDHFKRSLLY